ncbi:NAD(P)/FAD-dependent oxidoreductase [Pelagibacterium lacus]|uniref:NAD(P)/FAD-dependent oxidoreductase n=1 Tax=Pelagibacterium lacus TaxID=2282655 RepID=UPI00131401C8|nr:FAD-binding oxidoreductase [Pelagibacterium lacus]
MTPAARGDVAVIGGGMVGLASALQLQRRGRTVTLIDPGDPLGRASYGNAGVISRGSIFPVAGPGLISKLPGYGLGRSVAVRVNYRSLPRMAGWVRHFLAACNEASWLAAAEALDPLVRTALDHHMALADELGTRHHYRQTGFLRLYRQSGSLASAKRERSVLARFGIEAEPLDAAGIAALEPGLADRYAEGLHFTQSASVDDPGAIVAALYAAFTASAGHIAAHVTDIRPTNDDVELTIGGETHRFAQVVVAAGVHSASLARALGDRIPLVGERGYHRLAPWTGNARLTRPIYDVSGGFVASPMAGGARILSGVELALPDAPADESQIATVLADAARSLPVDADAAGPVWMGSRPSTPDSLPVIGFSRASRSVVYAFGHGHIGFANGPATGLAVAALLAGETPDFPIKPFSPQRF